MFHKWHLVALFLAVLLLAAVADGANIARTTPTLIGAGNEFEVSLSIAEMDAGGIVETIPDGFTYVSTTHPADETSVSGQSVIFSVIGETEITYRVRAPVQAGSGVFSGVWENVATLENGTIPATSVGVYVSSGGGGGDSGGSGSSSVTTTVASAANGTTGVPASRTFSFERTDVTAIAIAANASVEGASLSVETLDGPGSIPAASGVVYHYLALNLTGLDDTDLTGATVMFQVNRSWIAAHNISTSSIALARYHDGWSLLPTTRVGSDTEYISYKAEIPGFSVFAIIGTEISADQNVKTTDAPLTVATPKAASTEEAGGASSSGGGDMLPIIGAIVVLVVIVGIGAWYISSRKKDGDEK